VAVIGLGLVGGSLARRLAAGGARVLGSDLDPACVAAATREGVLDGLVEADGAADHPVDVVVLAVPVDRAPAVLAGLPPFLAEAPLITDAGSTKARICAASESLGLATRFVGAHPLAGDHRAGWAASRPDLFADAPVFLTPARDATPEALRRAHAFWQSVGGRPVVMAPEEHDRRLAWSSHLPQLVSTTLALTLLEAGVGREALGPGGRSMTRLAGSEPAMWAAIFLENREPLAAACAVMAARLDRMALAIENADASQLLSILTEARDWAGCDAG
jgi:prephenate dehydrogenase